MSTKANGKILIVEDDEGVAALERRVLTRQGFDVASVGTFAAGLTAVRTNAFDLVVADHHLNDGTGLELLTTIQSDGLDVPLILVTGFTDEATVIEAMRCGARDFVPKSAEYLQYLPEAVHRVLKAVRVERELAKSEARFKLFMDNSPAAAFVKDEGGRHLYANRAAQEILCREDWLGKTDIELWPAEVAQQLRHHDKTVLQRNRMMELREAVVLPTGETRHLLSYKFPMQDPSGQQLLGAMAVDVTQQLAAEDALRQRDEQLRQSQKMEAIGTLAGGVAHEFNNLLQAVLGYTRFAIASVSEDHPARADLQIVVSAAERAAHLTQQLLSFSRREPGHPMPLDVNVIVHELNALLRPLLGAQVQIELTLQEAIGLISADHVQIQQMLMNLCINARDAMPDGGKIMISTCEVGLESVDPAPPAPQATRYMAIAIADTGCGMTPEVKQKIFEPFFTTKPVGLGTGLGLAMVYAAVQHHGGAIKVDTEPGAGTRFTIYLPLLAARADEDASAPGAESSAPPTVLLAEDEPLVLEMTRRMLRGAGYRVLAAVDGREAMSLFSERKEDVKLLILDGVMPEMGGWEAVRQIRATGSSVPAIITTGYDREHMAAVDIEPAPHLIQKPFTCEQLLNAATEALEEACACR